MAYLPRYHATRLKGLLRRFPIVCILGPRQCGKTTFVKKLLPQWRYLDLEKPSDIAKVGDDPEGALSRWKERLIFDEAQRLPSLFPVLRSYVDENRGKKGRVILLGSASLGLVQNVSESLAGRVGFLDMAPFHLLEVKDLNRLWMQGGFPDAFFQKNSFGWFEWFEGYTRTYLEQDLNQLGIQVSASQMRKLWTMIAHHHGGLLNASELGGSLGTSYHTVNRYMDILEQTFIVRKLPPYFANLGKRMVKSPKIYLRDSGLLHYFLRIQDRENLDGHPKRGASWEGFVIEQIADFLSLDSPHTDCYFWRTATGHEVDLLLVQGNKFIPIEIKTHSAPTRGDLKGLPVCMKDLKISKGYVIRPRGERYSLGGGIEVITLGEFFASFF